jgi:hypothetical protein
MMLMMDAEISLTISVSLFVELATEMEQDAILPVKFFLMVKINPNHRN